MRSLLIMSLIVLACKKDVPPSITGQWQLTTVEYWQHNELTATNINGIVIYEFSDKQMSITEDGITDTYPATITDTKIKLNIGFDFNVLQLDYAALVLSKTDQEIEMKYYFIR